MEDHHPYSACGNFAVVPIVVVNLVANCFSIGKVQVYSSVGELSRHCPPLAIQKNLQSTRALYLQIHASESDFAFDLSFAEV